MRDRGTDRVPVISDFVNGLAAPVPQWVGSHSLDGQAKIGHQIRQDGTCEIGLSYDGRSVRVLEMGLLAWGRLRWRSVDQGRNRDQQGDHDQGGDRDRDRRSGM